MKNFYGWCGMVRNLKKGINMLIYAGQILLITGAFLMQYFSSRRMGMHRYLVYKNAQLDRYFTSEMMLIYQVILGAIFLVSCWCFFRKKRKTWGISLNFILLIFFMIGAVYFSLNNINEFKALYYLFISFAANIVVQTIRIIFVCARMNGE